MKANSIELENRLKKMLAPGKAEAGKRLPEFIALALYAGLYILITVYHEPWFDEAQSWQIGRYCSLREMLLVAPKYEGHPSFWWLLLAIPAKLGVPYELGLKSVGFLLSAAVAGMILFRSPFPRPVRLLLPFTYFLFYQYGVIVRPYTVMALAMFLAADHFEEKDQRPLPFVLSLGLLCLSSAYGIVLAGGLCIAWVWDLIREKGFGGLLREVFRDKRIRCLLGLLLLALLLIWQILPAEDMYNPTQDVEPHPIRNFLVLLVTLPADVLVTTSPWFADDRTLLQQHEPELMFVIAVGLLSLLLMSLFFLSFPRKRLKYTLIPYLLFVSFGSAVYLQTHHIGIVFLLLVMGAWENLTAKDPFALKEIFLEKVQADNRDRKVLQGLIVMGTVACLGVNLFWTCEAFVLDIQNQYCFGRKTAAFLQENGLDHLVCMFGLGDSEEKESEDDFYENAEITRVAGIAVLDPYFGERIFENCSGGEGIGYIRHVKSDTVVNHERMEIARTYGVPQVMIGSGNVFLMTDGAASMEDYAAVFKGEENHLWKGKQNNSVLYVYLKRDLLQQYALKEIEEHKTSTDMKIVIPEELQNRAKAGESITTELESLFNEAVEKMR